MIATIFIKGQAALGIGVFLFGIAEIIRSRQSRKVQEIELRKYCFEHSNPRDALFKRFMYVQRLEQYLGNGSITYAELPWRPVVKPETPNKSDTLTRPAPVFQEEKVY